MGKKKVIELIEEKEEEKYPLNEWGLRGTNLYLHQQNNIKKMEFQEANKERIYKHGTRTTKIYTNFGILNDKVGSGKTLTMTSLLSREKQQNKLVSQTHNYPWVVDMGSNHYFSYSTDEELSFTTIPINIIVVSSAIHNQWSKELDKTDLKYKKIVKTVDYITMTKSDFENLDVIIVTYNRYRELTHRFNIAFHTSNVGIKRLIFDELQLRGVLPMAKAEFYWIISATLPNESSDFTDRSTSNNAICRLLSNTKLKYISIKNSEDELRQSYQQAEIEELKYYSYNRQFNMYGNRVSNEVQRMIAADDIAGAITALGGTKDTASLMEIIIEKEEKEITHIKAQISYFSIINDENSKKKIDEYKEKLSFTEKALENLKEKIERDTEEDSCPLCFDEYKEQVLTYCCKSIMCSQCVKRLYQTTQKCPYCRKTLDMKEMAISSKAETPKYKKEDTRTKLEIVTDIITNKKNGKFILFSEFNNTFDSIKETLLSKGITLAEVKGTSDSKQKSIKLFKEGKIQVIFLNSRNDGSGIDLPEATDIILYHKMSSPSIETQVLGRALRLGRTSKLTVHRLLYTEEENMGDNPRSLDQMHSSHLPPEINQQDLYQRQLREEQEREDRELALRLQRELTY
jgi:superfamily II DNA or RNA helicase